MLECQQSTIWVWIWGTSYYGKTCHPIHAYEPRTMLYSIIFPLLGVIICPQQSVLRTACPCPGVVPKTFKHTTMQPLIMKPGSH